MKPDFFSNEYLAGDKEMGRAVLNYPSPFFDLASTYFPESVKDLFKFCVYYYNTNCIVPAIVNKLAEYPVTDLVFATETEKKELQEKWKTLFNDQLNMHRVLHEAGLDMGVYGNCFLGIYLPFKRFLVCPVCGATNHFQSCKDIKIKGKKLKVSGTCPSCGQPTTFEIKDRYIKSLKGINIIRYDPMSIDIVSDPVSGHRYYVWDPPQTYKTNIIEGKDLDAFERAPKIVLDAIAEDKVIRLRSNLFYHMKRPSLSGQSSAWGYPLVMHALKSLYYLQTLKRAQEAIAVQHIIPLWILFPASGGNSSMPTASLIGLNKWKTEVETELKRWKQDPNYIPILNEPVGQVQLGGEGRALLLGPEIQQEVQQIVASMSVPQEFVFGGLTWTGSSITLRMLENCFTGTRDGMQRFINFCVNVFSKYLKYQPIDIYMSELKMADDIQRQQIAMNLEASGKISTTRLLAEFGYDMDEETELKKKEAANKSKDYIRESILQAKAQGEGQLEAFDYQIKQQLKQVEAEGAMQVAQAKSQAIAQQKMMEMGIMPPQEGDPNAPQGEEAQGGAEQQGAPQQGEEIDQETGLPIDPQSGLPYDEQSGMLIDTATGCAINPQDGTIVDMQSGQQISQEEYQQRQAQGGQEAQAPQEGQQPTQEQIPSEAMQQMPPEQMPPEAMQQMPPEQMPPEAMQQVPPEQMPPEQMPPEEAYVPTMVAPPVETDPMTGLPIDPESGLPFDEQSGMLIDIYAGCGINVMDNVIIDLQTGQPIPPEEYMARQQASLVPVDGQGEAVDPAMDPGMMDPALMQAPMYPLDGQQKMSSFRKRPMTKKATLDNQFMSTNRQNQEAMIQQGVSQGAIPPSAKALVTTLAKQLINMQPVEQRRTLSEMQQAMPTTAQLVQQRMQELVRLQPSVNPPDNPDVKQKYSPLNQSRGMTPNMNRSIPV